jgi:hypothetical protein
VSNSTSRNVPLLTAAEDVGASELERLSIWDGEEAFVAQETNCSSS